MDHNFNNHSCTRPTGLLFEKALKSIGVYRQMDMKNTSKSNPMDSPSAKLKDNFNWKRPTNDVHYPPQKSLPPQQQVYARKPRGSINVKPSVGDGKQPIQCLCNRPKKIVWCLECGYKTEGNVSKQCLVHPLRRYLFEFVLCPGCGSRDLNETNKQVV